MEDEPLLSGSSTTRANRMGNAMARSYLGTKDVALLSDLHHVKRNMANSVVIKHGTSATTSLEHTKAFGNLMNMHTDQYKTWRRYDLCSAFFAFIGLVLALIEYELSYHHGRDKRHIHTWDRSVFRFLMIATWGISFICLVLRYYYKRKWQNMPLPKEVAKRVYSSQYVTLIRKNRNKSFISWNLIFDLIIITIQPVPGLEYRVNFREYLDGEQSSTQGTYLLSDFFLLFMFLRIYIVVRNIFNHSKFSDPYAKMH